MSKKKEEFQKIKDTYFSRIHELGVYLKLVEEKKNTETTKWRRKIKEILIKHLQEEVEKDAHKKIKDIFEQVKINLAKKPDFKAKSERSKLFDDSASIVLAKRVAKKKMDEIFEGLLHREKGDLIKFFAETYGFPFSSNILMKMTLVYSVLLFEQMLKDYWKFHLLNNPGLLMTKSLEKAIHQERVIEFSVALKAKSIKELKELIVEKEADRIGRMNIDQIEQFLKRRTNILFSNAFGKWRELRKFYYLRNIVVHNGGIMNSYVHEKIKCGEVGKSIILEFKDIQELIKLLSELNAFLFEKFKKKLKIK